MRIKDDHRNGEGQGKWKPHGSSLHFFEVCVTTVDSKHYMSLCLQLTYLSTAHEPATGRVLMVKELVRGPRACAVRGGCVSILKRLWKACLWGFLGHPLITPHSGMCVGR